jgi:hypothetical protein
MSAAGVYDAADPFAKEVLGRRRTFKDPVVGIIDPKEEYFLGDAEAKRVYAAGIEQWSFRRSLCWFLAAAHAPVGMTWISLGSVDDPDRSSKSWTSVICFLLSRWPLLIP